MREVLADALAFAVCIQTRRMHTRCAGNIFELAVHPVGGGSDGLLWIVVLGDALPHPPDPLALRRVVRWGEHLIEPVDNSLGPQIIAPDSDILVLRRDAAVGLHHGTRRDLELGVRSVQVERGYCGAPVVDIAVGPCGGGGFDAVENDVLPGVRARSQPCLVERRGHRRLVGVARRVHHSKPPHQISPSSMTREPLCPASCHATHGAEWKYCTANASPTSLQVCCRPASRFSSDSSSAPGCRNSSSLRARPSSRCASAVAPSRLCGRLSSSSRLCSASRSE